MLHLGLTADPAWLQRVDAAFDDHALDGVLSLPRFVEACRALDVPAAAMSAAATPKSPPTPDAAAADGGAAPDGELQQTLLAAWFVEWDEDASGRVDRAEFARNLWLLTRATEAERMAHVFHRLDMNGSGALERADLISSMRRQLALARRLMPILVRQQLRRQAVGAAAGGAGVGGAPPPRAAAAPSGCARRQTPSRPPRSTTSMPTSTSSSAMSLRASARPSGSASRSGAPRGTRPPRTITSQGAAASIHRLSGIDGVLGLL